MQEIKNIIEQLRQAKTSVLFFIFAIFILFFYRPLITTVVTSKIKKEDEVKKDIENNVLIQQMLNDLMLRFGSDRAYIFQFHNSIKYYDNTHRNHQSMSFEVCANGISSEAINLQNLPVSLFPMFLQQVMLDKMTYKDISNIKETSSYLFLKKQGVKSIFIAPYFKDGKFVAYIGIDFVKEKYNKDFNYNEFKFLANEIGRILVQ